MGKNAGAPGGYVAPGTQTPGHWDGFGPADRKWVPEQATPEGPYQQAAEAQASANRPTQNTPFGSTSWTRDPSTGAWTQNTSLAGGLGDAATSMQNQAASTWGVPLDNGATARTNADNAIYGRETSRLDPQWNQREQGMQASLANQGLAPDSAAAQTSMDTFNRGRNDAYSSAMQQAIMGGGAEASRQQAMDLQSRMAPLQGLQGLQQLLHMPGFQPGPNYLAAAQAANDYNLQNSQMQNQMYGDYFSGLAGLGMGAMMM